MMQQGGDAQVLPQRCNLCWNEANGACFRTRCGHLFCESCAFQHFGQSQACAACGLSLEEADISELNLGLAPSHYEKIVFQEIYKEPDYMSMGQSLARTAMLLHDSVSFVMGQVVFNGQRMAKCDASKTSEMAKMKYEMGRMAMKMRNQTAEAEQKLSEMDHKLRLREKELVEIQEAYKDKDRRCSAWEKAYGHLRAQLDRGDRVNGGRGAVRGGFTPPESPRAGVMRGGGGPPSSFAGMAPAGLTGSTQRQQPSPRRSGGADSSGGRAGAMPRPVDRSRTLSPHSSSRAGAYAGHDSGGRSGGGGGGGGGSRSSWPMARPTTSRGGGGGHVSPMLRPRQSQAFSSSHAAVTPSPTFSAQRGGGDTFPAKKPETPVGLQGYYPSGGRSAAAGGGGGGSRGGTFFPANKSGFF